jgi:thiol-disulfide isomerase/thioredoxin
MNQSIIYATDSTLLDIVEQREKPILVMVFLPTCSHCRAIEPHFREYSKQYGDSVNFVMVNPKENPGIAKRYNIRGTPTFLYFCDGNLIKTEVGAMHPANLKRSIDEMIHSGSECAKKTTSLDYDISLYE